MVVFVKFNKMEADGRRGKRVGIWRRMFPGPWSTTPISSPQQSPTPIPFPHERRPLRSVPALGSQFKVDPDVLAKEYVEKETKYLGTVTDVSLNFDPGNRSMVLSLLDEKKKLQTFPTNLTWQHDVILSFSVYNVKILWRDGEELIHRIPTHQIAAAGYVQDDSQLYLFIKFASEVNEQLCNLAFFCCENKVAAQEICHLTKQLFQLAYTNSTMDFFDQSIQDGAITPKHHSFSTDDSTDKKQQTVKLQGHFQVENGYRNTNQKRFSLNGSSEIPHSLHNGKNPTLQSRTSKASTLPLSSTLQHHNSPRSVSPTSSTPSSPAVPRVLRSESNASSILPSFNSQQLKLKEYIEVLKERLTNEELHQFAECLHGFRHGALTIKTFCERLMSIYTERRKSLLLGMRHFMPEAQDRYYLESFLKLHKVETGSDDVRWWNYPPKSRTFSETEGSCASTTVQLNELSSNSDHVSPFHTSNEDSGEWKAVVSKLERRSVDGLSTLRKKQTQEYRKMSADPFLPATPLISGKVRREIHFDRGPPLSQLFLDTNDDPAPKSNQFVGQVLLTDSSQNREEKHVTKKKSREKSSSAIEFGAPFPSSATGGSDDDLRKTFDKKAKRGLKYMRKDKSSRSNSDETDKIPKTALGSKEVLGAKVSSLEHLIQSPVDSDKISKKKFFKKGAKSKTKEAASSTPDPRPVETVPKTIQHLDKENPKKDHGKKKKHKLPPGVEPATALTFL